MIVLREHYKTSHNWKGKRYLGLDVDRDHDNCKVHLSILAYVTDALTRFQHDNLSNPQHQPYPQIKPTYGSMHQYTEAEDLSPPLSKSDRIFSQEVTGTFLDYARAFNPTMLTALGSIAAQQPNKLFNSCKESIPSRQTLEEMGNTQPPTLMQTDNTTTHGVVTNNIVSK